MTRNRLFSNAVTAATIALQSAAALGLDLNVDAIPIKQKTTDVASAIAWSLANAKSRNLAKSEFETQQEYAARTAAVRLPGIDGDGMVMAMLPTNSAQLRKRYMAEDKTLFLELTLEKSSKFAGPAYLIIGDKTLSSRQYIGTNAFGVKKQIRAQEIESHGFAVTKTNAGYSDMARTIIFSVEMAPAEARAALPNIAIVAIGKPASPLVTLDVSYSSPTIDDPYDITRRFKMLELVGAQLWVVNKASGAVLQKDSVSLK